MSITVLVAAAAVAVGVGQAEAATYDVIFTLNSHVYTNVPFEGDYTRSFLDSWNGLPVMEALAGVLDITDDWMSLVVSGVAVAETDWGRGVFTNGDLNWTFGNGWSFTSLRWTGEQGTFNYFFDGARESWQVDATLELTPVPLPATAVVLPVGLGALAMLRRRRKA